MNDLTIAEIEIRQDEHGRYSLNDLYRASGGEKRNAPNEWMRNKQTKALIEEIDRELEAGIPGSKFGKNKPGIPGYSVTQKAGAFVVKELVYAYAMWISPAFNLKVIRAYDALVTGEIGERDRRVSKFERAYFKRYPMRRVMRDMALKGEPYWYIASVIGCAAGTVGNAIRHMIEWGLMEAQRLLVARTGMQSWWAYRRKHRLQASLF